MTGYRPLIMGRGGKLKGRATIQYSSEQQELLDSGLRMLAHMIAETHLHRIALRKKNETSIHSPKTDVNDNSPEDHHE